MRFGLREAMFFLLLLAVPVASYFLVFEPRNAHTEEVERENREKQAKLETLRQATATTGDDLGAEIDRLREAIAVFERKLPAQRDFEVILREVAELAKEHALLVKSLQTDKVIMEAGYSKQPIRLEMTGDFDRFYSFMQDLERLERITKLPRMELKRTKRGQATEGDIEAEVRLDIFFEGVRAAQPRAAAPTRSNQEARS